MKRATRFLKNITSSYLVTGVDALIFVLLTPFVVHKLGLEHYAVWVIMQTLGYYLDFLDFGVSDAQIRQHARLHAEGDGVGISRLNGTVFVLYTCAGAAAMLLAASFALFPTAHFFDIPPSAQYAYTPLLLLLGMIAAAEFIDNGIDGIFEGYQRFDLMNGVHLVISLASAIAIVAVLGAGYGLIALAIVTLLGGVLSIAIKLAVVRRTFPAAAQPHLRFDGKTFDSIKEFSLWNSLNDFMTEGTAQFDRILIPILLSSALVTPYSLVVTLAAAIFLLAEPLTDMFLPMTAIRHRRSDRGGMAILLTRGTKLVALLTLPVAVVVIAFGETILDLWIGAEYTDIPPTVLWFTAGNFLFSTLLWTPLTLLMGAGAIRSIFRMSVIEVGIVLILILTLVPIMGLPGLALAGLLANVLTGLILIVPTACKLTTLSAASFCAQAMAAPLLAATPTLALALALERWASPTTWVELLSLSALSGLATLTAVLFFGASRLERRRYLATGRRIIRSR